MMVEIVEIPYIVATIRANITMMKENKKWKFKSIILHVDEGFNKLMKAKKTN